MQDNQTENTFFATEWPQIKEEFLNSWQKGGLILPVPQALGDLIQYIDAQQVLTDVPEHINWRMDLFTSQCLSMDTESRLQMVRLFARLASRVNLPTEATQAMTTYALADLARIVISFENGLPESYNADLRSLALTLCQLLSEQNFTNYQPQFALLVSRLLLLRTIWSANFPIGEELTTISKIVWQYVPEEEQFILTKLEEERGIALETS